MDPEFEERFDRPDLDTDVWLPYYLPHWSSRARTAATYGMEDGSLRLTIPTDQGLWCEDLHDEPLRVSCVQSGCFAGALGSRSGQQPFVPDQVVREEQPILRGYVPLYGRIEVRARAIVTARSMFAFWMVGFEDQPERSGEICVAEVFGDTVRPGFANVGMGIHPFRDPALTEDFAADPFPIDVSEFHTYAVDWLPDRVRFLLDGEQVRTVTQSPTYPMQLMIGVFDFPAKADPTSTEPPVPELVIDHVLGRRSH